MPNPAKRRFASASRATSAAARGTTKSSAPFNRWPKSATGPRPQERRYDDNPREKHETPPIPAPAKKKYRVIGTRPDPSRRRRQGHRPGQVRRRCAVVGNVVWRHAPQSPRPRANSLDRHCGRLRVARRSGCDHAGRPSRSSPSHGGTGGRGRRHRALEPQCDGPREGALPRTRRRRGRRRRHPHRGRGRPLDPRRVRSLAAGPLCPRRHAGRRADPARRSPHAVDRRREVGPPDQYRPPLPLRKRQRGRRLRAWRRSWSNAASTRRPCIRATSSPTTRRPNGTPTDTSRSGPARKGRLPRGTRSAGLLGIPVSRIKVVPMEIGGGFGGKIAVYLEPLAAVLSRKTGRPVKLVMDRTSVFEATGPTPASHIRVKIGADADGPDHRCRSLAGVRGGRVSRLADQSRLHVRLRLLRRPQRPRRRVRRRRQQAADQRLSGARRDERRDGDRNGDRRNLRRTRRSIRLDFRANNAAKEGTRRIDGPVFSRIGMAETVEAIRESEHWNVAARRTESRTGRRFGLLVQRRTAIVGDRDRQHRRPGFARRRFHRYRRQPHGDRHAVGRDARHFRRRRHADRRRHRRRRLHRRDRRQPRDLRDRLGRLRSGPGHPPTNDRAGRRLVGRRPRTSHLRGRRHASRTGRSPHHVPRIGCQTQQDGRAR